jgi:hypothetical protein
VSFVGWGLSGSEPVSVTVGTTRLWDPLFLAQVIRAVSAVTFVPPLPIGRFSLTQAAGGICPQLVLSGPLSPAFRGPSSPSGGGCSVRVRLSVGSGREREWHLLVPGALLIRHLSNACARLFEDSPGGEHREMEWGDESGTVCPQLVSISCLTGQSLRGPPLFLTVTPLLPSGGPHTTTLRESHCFRGDTPLGVWRVGTSEPMVRLVSELRPLDLVWSRPGPHQHEAWVPVSSIWIRDGPPDATPRWYSLPQGGAVTACHPV